MGLFSNSAADDVVVSATFPDNPFGLIVNGAKNAINIHLSNAGAKNYKLVSAAASYHNPTNNWALVRNATTQKYNVDLISGSNFSAPFTVNSEFRPQELGLTVWVNLAETDSKIIHHVTAYNSTVSITEPPSSIFDLQLVFLYLVLLAGLSGLAYLLYDYLKPTPRRRTKKAIVITKDTIDKNGNEVISTTVKPYEEEWIPAQQLKNRQNKGGKVARASASGTEGFTSGGEATSGAETSGNEGKSIKRKGKKA